MTQFTEQVRQVESPHKFGFKPRKATILWLASLDGSMDDQTGSDDYGVWVARFGRHFVCCNDQGFVWHVGFETEQKAKERFEEIDNDYSEWMED